MPNKKTSHQPPSWYVYIVRCADNSLYTGIAKDIEKRITQHNTDDRTGSRYTRARRPVALAHQETFTSRSEASKREAAIKKLSKQQKEQLITNNSSKTASA